MAEPTSEWGKELVQQVHQIEVEVSRLMTMGKVLAWAAPIVLGLATWTLLNVTGLQTSAAVLDASQKSISEDIKRISGDIRRISDEVRRDRETTERLQVATTRLQTIVERLERIAPPPPGR